MSAAAGAAVVAAIAQAIKASGVLVRVSPEDFQKILRRMEEPLVIYTTGGFFKTNHQYLTSYKGLAFYTKSETEIIIPVGTETILSQSIWIP